MRFLAPILVFFLILFSGISWLLFLKGNKSVVSKNINQSQSVIKKDANSENIILAPLALPLGYKAKECSENSWEFTGETKDNFVTTRGKFISYFQNQGWVPDKKITFDESLSPQVVLTFTQGDYELILMLWRIDNNLSGFSYRREKKSEFTGEIIE